MAKYRLISNGVQDMETKAFIPDCGGNRHWQEYQEWLGLGNTPDPEFTTEQIEERAWNELRSERNSLLTKTDFMMSYDFYNTVLTSDERTQLSTYRQTLRDLPENTIDPSTPTWPSKPQIVLDYGI